MVPCNRADRASGQRRGGGVVSCGSNRMPCRCLIRTPRIILIAVARVAVADEGGHVGWKVFGHD